MFRENTDLLKCSLPFLHVYYVNGACSQKQNKFILSIHDRNLELPKIKSKNTNLHMYNWDTVEQTGN